MEKTPQDHARVIALPPVLYVATLLVGVVLQIVDRRPLFASPAGRWAGAALVALGLVIAVWGRKKLEHAGTTVNPYGSTTSIVTTGPFRFTRNPLYLALTLVYAGIALLINGLWPMLLMVPLLVIVQTGVIAREERYLEEKFGDEYRAYRARVRRWL